MTTSSKTTSFLLLTNFLTLSCVAGLFFFLYPKQDKTAQPFKDVRIIFFVGGPEDHYFARVVHNGAMAAQRDLGCQVEYVFSDWESATMLKHFKEAIEKQPDARVDFIQ